MVNWYNYIACFFAGAFLAKTHILLEDSRRL
jgi:hypothetical protein